MGKRARIIIDLKTGVTLHVAPISPFAYAAIVQKATAQYPLPDKREYEHQIEGQESAAATLDPLDEHNPRKSEYVQAFNDATTKQMKAIHFAITDLCVTFPTFDSRDDMVKTFYKDFVKLQEYAELDPDDVERPEWYQVFRYVVISTADEWKQVMSAASWNGDIEPVTGDEMLDAFDLFRLRVQKPAVILDSIRQATQTIANLKV